MSKAWLRPRRGRDHADIFPVVSLRSTTGYGADKPSALGPPQYEGTHSHFQAEIKDTGQNKFKQPVIWEESIMQIHIMRNGEQFGPYSEEEVREHLAQGLLLPADLAWHEGIDNWAPLSDLIVAPKQKTPPPPPIPVAPRRNSLYIACCLVAVLAGIIAIFCIREFDFFRHASVSAASSTAYCGIYRCTESFDGAGGCFLK